MSRFINKYFLLGSTTFVFLTLVFGACKPVPEEIGNDDKWGQRRGIMADSAMVVSAHSEASRIGIEILKKGGNAVDAAVAVQFGLAVCFPYAGNVGGGGFMVLRLANGEAFSLDFREKAPEAAHRDMYLDEDGNVILKLSARGLLSVGVPGSVDGMARAHDRFGTLPWTDLLQPAIDLAGRGYPASENQADWLNRQKEEFQQYNPDGSHYLVKEAAWEAGDTVKMLDFVRVLERIRDQGRKGFYEGKTADLVVAEMQKGGGIITLADLENYESTWRKPLIGMYRDHKVISMGPPSSGGLVLLQMLGMARNYPLAEWGFGDARTVHTMVETERRAYADRAEFLGDPDFWDIPMKGLLAPDYLLNRMGDFEQNQASSSEAMKHGKPGKESTETTHFSILDAAGNAVSITTTINSAYGSKVWVEGGGFLLNNEMDDFSAKPGVPNIYGLIGKEANAVQPGKRMLSSMTPTIVEKDGKVNMILGTPGGSTIITSVYQCIVDVVDHGMSMQEAVDQPRFHHQWLPDQIAIEDGAFSATTWQALRKMGHYVCLRSAIGRVDAILVHPDGRIEGAADARRDDAAEGY